MMRSPWVRVWGTAHCGSRHAGPARSNAFSTPGLVKVCLVPYYGLAAQPLRSAMTSAGHATAEQAFVPLRAERPGTFEIHPAYQRHRFTIAGTVDVSETTFVPLGEVMERPDEPVVFQLVELRNNGRTAQRLRVAGFARFRGTLTPDVSAYYDPAVDALIAVGSGHPNAVRCYGLSRPATKYATTIDFGRVYDPTHLHPLHNDTSEGGDILGNLQLDIDLQPGEIASFAFSCALYDAPTATALREYRGLPSADDALARTIRYLERTLSIAEVLTPNRYINEGALWSKVNMRRVMAQYSQGPAFTNEPGASSNIVGRDAAWFVYGNDHFMPAFSRRYSRSLPTFSIPTERSPNITTQSTGRWKTTGSTSTTIRRSSS